MLGVHGQNMKERVITIEPMMSSQNYEHFRRMVFNSPDSELEGGLEGFDFVWGYRYKVKVKETELDGWLSDGTRFEYEFIEVANKEKAGDTIFKMFLDPQRYYYELPPEEAHLNQTLVPVNDSVFNYLEKVDIVIPEELMDAF